MKLAQARTVLSGRTGLLAVLGLYLVVRLAILGISLLQTNIFVAYATFSYALRGDPAGSSPSSWWSLWRWWPGGYARGVAAG